MRAAWARAAAVAAEVLGWAWVFTAADHMSYPTAVYFAVETATTVGYGDVTPRAAGAHWLAVVMMLTVIPTLGALFGRLSALHTIKTWHRQHGPAAEAARAAHQIAADLYRASTGEEHPAAPGQQEAP